MKKAIWILAALCLLGVAPTFGQRRPAPAGVGLARSPIPPPSRSDEDATNSGVPGDVVLIVIAERMSFYVVRITWGVDIYPLWAINTRPVVTQMEIAADGGFAHTIYSKTFPVYPMNGTWIWNTSESGKTLYFRARLGNEYGWGNWSPTVTKNVW